MVAARSFSPYASQASAIFQKHDLIEQALAKDRSVFIRNNKAVLRQRPIVVIICRHSFGYQGNAKNVV